jgi:hypothetical protein
MKKIKKNNIWIYDIETYPNLFCVTFKKVNEDEVVVFEISETIQQVQELTDFCKGIWLVGYNSLGFDNIVINYIITNKMTDVNLIYRFSQQVIQNNYEVYRPYKYNRDYKSIDLMSLLFSKMSRVSLKSLEVSMKFHNVQDLPYHWGTDLPFDAIQEVIDYNLNDVLATEKLYNICLPDIKLRSSIKKQFKLDCFSKDGVKTGVDLLQKLYCDKTNQDFKEVGELRTFRKEINLGEVISDKVQFKSKEFNELLLLLKGTTIVETKGSLDYSVTYGGVTHQFGTGGLHSKDKPGIVTPTKDEIYRDADVTSLYPSLLIEYGFVPEHLDKDAFIEVYGDLKTTRVEAKKRGDMVISDTYKLSLNGAYGNLINSYSWLYDPKQAMGITLNGQLFLSMLSEQLTDAGFKVDSINTDGITCLVPKDRVSEYNIICKKWEETTNLNLEYAEYAKVIRRDVNCYYAVLTNGYVKEKGAWSTEIVLGKGYDKPIIAIALKEYFINNIPVATTIMNHTDIYDFCMAQKVGGQFTVEYLGKEQQRINRYYSSKTGAYLYKVKGNSKSNISKNNRVKLFNKFEDKPMKDYEVNYSYYIEETLKIIDNVIPSQLTMF